MVFEPKPDVFGVRGVIEPALLEPGVWEPERREEGVKEARRLELPIPSLFVCLLNRRWNIFKIKAKSESHTLRAGDRISGVLPIDFPSLWGVVPKADFLAPDRVLSFAFLFALKAVSVNLWASSSRSFTKIKVRGSNLKYLHENF